MLRKFLWSIVCLVATCSIPAAAQQTQNMCVNVQTPAGWATIHIFTDTSQCSPIQNNVKTVERIDTLPSDSVVVACNDDFSKVPVAGWVITDFTTDPIDCGGGTFDKRALRNLNGDAIGTQLTICNTQANVVPSGWTVTGQTTDFSRCSRTSQDIFAMRNDSGPDLAISATPPSQTVPIGGTTTYDIAINRLNGLTGNVALSVDSALPAAVSATFSPNNTPGASSTMFVTTGNITPAGSFIITIKAQDGIYVRRTNVTLNTTTVIQGNGIQYNGGPIMVQHNAYLIWYGNWTGNTALTIFPDLVIGFDGSPYLNTLTTYFDSHHATVQNQMALSGQAFNYYTHGSTLDDVTMQAVLRETFSSGTLTPDPNGLYIVMTTADVGVTAGGASFCQDFCGYHSHASIQGLDIKYAFVGNPDRCPSACPEPGTPNGNPGADGMASVIGHEVAEAITDPDPITGWNRNSVQLGEVGDLCVGQIGSVSLLNRQFLLQPLWVNAQGGFCGFSFGTPPPPPPTPTTPMQRYITNTGHTIINGLTHPPSGAIFEGTLGTLSLVSGSGKHPLYSCAVTVSPAFQFVSLDVNCEGQRTKGLEGYVFDNPGPSVRALYRCRNGADHFASGDPNCEGTINEGLLGYMLF